MKKLLFTLLAVLIIVPLIAQDFIYKNDGGEIKSKVIEITPDFIKYRKWENQTGPIYNIKIADVFMVVYENGEREVFKKNEVVQEIQQPLVQPAQEQPKQPQNQYQQPQQPQTKSQKSYQSNVQIGITAGLGLASASYNYSDKDAQPTGGPLLSPMGGLTFNFGVSDKFAIQTGLYYMQKGDKVNLEKTYQKFYPGKEIKTQGSFKSILSYIEIPLTFNFIIPYGNSGSGVLIGPGAFFAYGIAGKEKSDYTVEVQDHGQWEKVADVKHEYTVKFVSTVPAETADETVYIKGSDMGLVFNIALKNKRFMLSSITSIGLVNTRPDKVDSDYNPDDEKVKSICGYISLTYFFNK